MDTNLNNISPKLKQRFCTDCNIPINIFQEPYFFNRILLYDKFYDTKVKWARFATELKKYKCEQDYFEDYNRIKDEAINVIKSSEAYQRFNDEDMNKFAITHKNLPSKDIYHPSNDGKTFISIDMTKANFSALRHYSECMSQSMFAGASTWEDFISLFTDNQHIIASKYIRQVILGNCNPKRHITYEKYLMDMILTKLLEDCVLLEDVVFFSNDEIIVDVSDLNSYELHIFKNAVKKCLKGIYFPLKIEVFTLKKINGTDGYCKFIYTNFALTNIKFKCLDSLYLPFVIRKFNNEEVTESDKVFYHNGLLAKFVEEPEIELC